ELKERRRRAMDVRYQAHRHPVGALAACASIIGALGGAIALAIARRRRRRSPRARLHALRLAVRRMLEHPDHVARVSPSTGRKIPAAGGSAAASVLGKRMARKLAR